MTEDYKASHHLSPHQPMGCRIRVAARKGKTLPLFPKEMKAGYKKTHTEKTLCEDVYNKRGATSVNGQMILPFTHSPLTRSRTIRGAYLNFYCFQFNRLSSAQCSHQSATCSQCPQAPWKQIHATFWLLLLYQINIKCQLFSEYWGDLGQFFYDLENIIGRFMPKKYKFYLTNRLLYYI